MPHPSSPPRRSTPLARHLMCAAATAYAVGVGACFSDTTPIDRASESSGGETGSTSATTGGGSVGETASPTGGPSSGGSASSQATTVGPGDSSSDPTGMSDTTSTTNDASTGVMPSECDGETRTVFVNFDGATFVSAQADDAPNNETSLFGVDRPWAPYAGADREAVFETVVAAFAEFDVCLTDVRPAGGDYAMVVVTADDHTSGALAFATPDCGNAFSDRDVGVVFGIAATYGTAAKGFIIASVIGNLFGLGLVEGAPDDIMKVSIDTNDSDLSFTTTCYPLELASSCPPTTCSGDMQSSRDYLEAVIGLAE